MRSPSRRSQNIWPEAVGRRRKAGRTFLRNHAEAIAAVDMCMVPTLNFERVFAFLVLGHGRRQLLWFEVTRHPTAIWLARQITEAFPWASAHAYLVRDNDRAYGHVFTTRVTAMGIRDRPISPGSPWQNGIAERLIGTLRRECLNHMVIFGEAHLRRILSAYAVYYNQTRTHLALNKDCPLERPVQRFGRVAATPFWLAYIISMSGYDFRKGQAFPWDEAPGYLVRDHDRIYGDVVLRRIRAMGDRPERVASVR